MGLPVKWPQSPLEAEGITYKRNKWLVLCIFVSGFILGMISGLVMNPAMFIK